MSLLPLPEKEEDRWLDNAYMIYLAQFSGVISEEVRSMPNCQGRIALAALALGSADGWEYRVSRSAGLPKTTAKVEAEIKRLFGDTGQAK